MLNSARAKALYRRNGSIMFKAGVFRMVSSWNILFPFGSGQIDVRDVIDSVEIKYELSTLKLLINATLMIIVFLVIVDYLNFNFTIMQNVWLFVFGWLWIF